MTKFLFLQNLLFCKRIPLNTKEDKIVFAHKFTFKILLCCHVKAKYVYLVIQIFQFMQFLFGARLFCYILLILSRSVPFFRIKKYKINRQTIKRVFKKWFAQNSEFYSLHHIFLKIRNVILFENIY